jgi:hypothetical protein
MVEAVGRFDGRGIVDEANGSLMVLGYANDRSDVRDSLIDEGFGAREPNRRSVLPRWS